MVAHVDTVLRHGMKDTIASAQLKGSLEVAKVELGLPGALFRHNYSKFRELITDSWVWQPWKEFLAEQICITKCMNHLVLAQHGDCFLIEAFHRNGFRKKQRLHLI
jgi:hypothetical protein